MLSIEDAEGGRVHTPDEAKIRVVATQLHRALALARKEDTSGANFEVYLNGLLNLRTIGSALRYVDRRL